MVTASLSWLFSLLPFIVNGQFLKYATTECGIRTPDVYGGTLYFDPTALNNQMYVPLTADWNCTFTIVGRPNQPMSVNLRNFEMYFADQTNPPQGQSVGACGSLYLQISGGEIGENRDTYTFCGAGAYRRTIEFNYDALVFRFVAVYIPIPTTVTTVTTVMPTTVTDNSTMDPNVTITTTTMIVTTPTTPPITTPTPSPIINFTIDVTSFIRDCGNNTDFTYFQCSLTKRCLGRGLKCDIQFGEHCRTETVDDFSDINIVPPEDPCIAPPPTIPPTPVPPVDLLPLYITLGILAGLAMLYWCCWKPGFLPWRLARLRNVFCINRLCVRPCQKIACCRGLGCCGPKSAACSRLCGPCSGNPGSSGGGYSGGYGADGGYSGGDGGGTGGDGGGTGDAFAGDGWLSFANGDGGHLRENR